MSNRMRLIILVVGCLLLLLALQKGFPFLLVLPLVIPLFWGRRRQ